MKLSRKAKALLKMATNTEKGAIRKAAQLLLRYDIISPKKSSTIERTL